MRQSAPPCRRPRALLRGRVALAVLGSAVAAWTVASPVAAQGIQRCEDARGAVTYANGPCPAGSKPRREVDTSPPVAVADQKAARERATRDARQLERLQRDRKAEEAKADKVRADATRKEEARQRECKKLAGRVDAARDVAGSATLAQRTDAERKLRRVQDQYTRDCGSS